jgi:hypothetical protein
MKTGSAIQKSIGWGPKIHRQHGDRMLPLGQQTKTSSLLLDSGARPMSETNNMHLTHNFFKQRKHDDSMIFQRHVILFVTRYFGYIKFHQTLGSRDRIRYGILEIYTL